MIETRIEPAVREVFPDIVVGIVVARGIDNRTDGPGAEAAQGELERAIAAAAEGLQGEVDWAALPAVAPWRAAYAAFGVKPSKFRSSIEALLRSAASGRLGSVNPLVDLYNAVSLEHRVPCGGEDLATIDGALRLDRAAGGEPFTPVGSEELLPALPGEVVWRDDAGIVCRCFNWREADRTCLRPHTTDAVLVIESVAPGGAEAVRAACDDLAARVTRCLGGETDTRLIS